MQTLTINQVLRRYNATTDTKLTEWIDMDVDQCEKTRWKAITTLGRVVIIDLPRHVRISHEDVVYEDDDRVIVARVKPHWVLVMKPKTFHEMGSLCYHIGNLHQPCLVQEQEVFTPNEEFLKSLADSLSVSYSLEERILPQGFATKSRSQHVHHV
ncbi:hypothetical protein [Sulfobacillus thermosulfidooxidans]|uniref:hypothetical protein n=1 Tax=Sulfobacillus thermosulfidooxidans TaxID=28034 RepID=UPI001180B8FD|nr:hypothetical protein [Sulfobacillus thermosulfidooxidans]